MIITNLMIGFPTMLLCLVMQVAVSFWAVRYYARHRWGATVPQRFLAGIRPLLVIMLAMMAGNFVQIAVWGILFVLLGEFDELYEALYHSAVNYASLGYGDIVMSKPWKLLGPLEAVNGVLMVGMTAAALMAILQQLVKAQRDALAAHAPGA
jgi:carbon starvation protein CstA